MAADAPQAAAEQAPSSVDEGRLLIERAIATLQSHLPSVSEMVGERHYPRHPKPADEFYVSGESFTYEGHITDCCLITPSTPGLYPTVQELRHSQDYHFSADDLSGSRLAPLRVRQRGPHSTRGDFVLASDDVRMYAFLVAWGEAVGSQNEERSRMFSEMSTCVPFIVTSTKSGDPIQKFWANFRYGENDNQTAFETNNGFTFRRLGKIEHLAALLGARDGTGERTTATAVWKEVERSKKAKDIKFSSKETDIKNLDQVTRMMAFGRSLREADVFESFKSLQFTPEGGRTPLASWTVALKLTSHCKTAAELKWVVDVLKAKTANLREGARVVGPELKFQDDFMSMNARDTTFIPSILFQRELVFLARTDLAPHEHDPHKATISEAFDQFETWGGCHRFFAQADQTKYSDLGDHMTTALETVKAIALGDNYLTLKTVVCNAPTASLTERLKDARIHKVVSPMMAAWRLYLQKHETSLPPRQDSQGAEAALPPQGAAAVDSEGAGAPGALDAAASLANKAAEDRKAALEKAVDKEMEYVYIITSSETSLLKDAVAGSSAAKAVIPSGEFRLSHFSPSLDNEPPQGFGKGHNPYYRAPGMKKPSMQACVDVWDHVAVEGADVLIISDGGHSTSNGFAKKACAQVAQAIGEMTVIPTMSGLDARRVYALRRKGTKRGKVDFADLSRVQASLERIMFFGRGVASIPERSHSHIAAVGFESTRSPFLPVPLPDPVAILPRITQAEKRAILSYADDGVGKDTLADGPAVVVSADAPDDEDTCLFHFDHALEFWLDLLHTMYGHAVIDFTPGNGTLGMACIHSRRKCLLVAKSLEHANFLHTHIRAQILGHCVDVANERFYKSDVSLGLVAPTLPAGAKQGDDLPVPSESE